MYGHQVRGSEEIRPLIKYFITFYLCSVLNASDSKVRLGSDSVKRRGLCLYLELSLLTSSRGSGSFLSVPV